MSFTERAAQLDQGAQWTADQTFDALAAAVVTKARQWAAVAFLAIQGEAEAAGHATAAAVTLNLIADTERLADFLEATPEQRRALIVERVGVFKGRLEDLMSGPSVRGGDA